ncbi:hypothetical protein D3C80_649000 [compost metagenome]
MAAKAFDLVNRRCQDFFTQLFAQLGDDVLADMVGADVREDRAQQRQHAESGERQDHALAEAAFGMQAIVDGGQQRRDAQAADHAQGNRQSDDRPERFEQGKQLAQRPAWLLGHREVLLRRW